MQNKKQAFTLVELIVVITILAILGTIAFISLQGYSASSRDSVRISDVSNMKTSLELFHLNAGKYPLPDNAEEVTYDTETLWYQGTFGSTVVSQLSRNISEIPTDSLSDKEYIYSVANNKNEFQILNLLEGDLVLNSINQTNAATSTRIPKVDGQYNGVFIKTATDIVPTPSLITSEDTTGGLTLNSTNIKSQTTTGGKNIPNVGNINTATGQLNITLSVYNGTINKDSSNTDKENVMRKIQDAYSGSVLANSDIYAYILSKNTTDDLVALLDTLILNKTNTTSAVVDTNAPTGGDFTIIEGTTTNTTNINLTITCPEETGVEMYVSGDITETQAWETCTNTKTFTVTTGGGIKEITIKWRDSILNETVIVSKNIELITGFNVSQLGGNYSEELTNFINTIPNGHRVLFVSNIDTNSKSRFKKHINLGTGRPYNYFFESNAFENYIGGSWNIMIEPATYNYHDTSTPNDYRLGGGQSSCLNSGMIISNFRLCYNYNHLGALYEFTVYDGGLY